MNKESLIERREAVKQRFDTLESQHNNIGTEMSRLQGEYRVLTELIDQSSESKEAESDPAQTIGVKPEEVKDATDK